MSEKKAVQTKKTFSPDWFVSGVLAKIGETFDKLTGRNWKPSSSLATSELIERLRRLLDSEVKENGKGRFVPHNIKLKMQWDKFSTDAEGAMKKLENELLAAAIDHINDNRYHTFAPLKVQIKPDYFTDGVKLLASFEEFAADEQEAEMNVTIPQIKVGNLVPPPLPAAEPEPETGETFIAEFSVNEKSRTVELNFKTGKRISVGRTKENDLSIDDTSISKNHATLMLNAQGKFLVADTGSTNGTFINNERIAYGRAFAVSETDKVKFGNIEVFFRKVPKPTTFVAEAEKEPAVEIESENHQAESRKTVKQENILTEAFNTKDYDLGIIKPSAAIQPERKTVENPERKTVETEDWAEGLPVKNGSPENPQVEGVKEEESVQKTEQGIKLDFGESGKS